MTIIELKAIQTAKRIELDALMQSFEDAQGNIKSDITEEQFKQAEALTSEIKSNEESIKKLEKLESIKSANRAAVVQPLPSAAKTETKVEIKMPTSRNWVGKFESPEAAYKSGRFIQAFLGDSDAKQWCSDNGIDFKALTSSNEGSAGLFIVPELEASITKLMEQYGVIGQHAKTVSTNTAQHTFWKRVSGNSAYFISEQGTPTSTDAAYQSIMLTAKTAASLTKFTLQLQADSAINLASEIASELAYGHAVLKDQACFIGDGTSTYGNIVGISYKFRQIFEAGGGTWGTNMTYLGGAVIAAGNAFSEFTLQNFVDTVNSVAQYPGMSPKWYIHDKVASATMWRLWYALGGNQTSDIVNGVPAKFLGYPVVYVNAMPFTDANDQVACLFGDLSLGSVLCNRQGLQLATNTQSETNFLTGSAQVKSTERYDFVAHDVGNYHATAASRTRGAIAALISAHS